MSDKEKKKTMQEESLDKLIPTDTIPGAASMTPEELLRAKKKKAEINYILIAYFEKVKEIELKKDIEKFKRSMDDMMNELIGKNKLPDYVTEAAKAVNNMEESKKLITSFFSYKDRPDAEEIKKTLDELDMTDEDFSLVALAATGEKAAEIVEAANKDIVNTDSEEKKKKEFEELEALEGKKSIISESNIKEDKASEKLLAAHGKKEKANLAKFDSIRDKSILEAKEAIMSLKKGNPEVMGRMLGNFMVNACDHFARTKDNDLAVQWSLYAGEMMRMMEKKPELIKHCGLSEKQLATATNVVKVGKTIKDGLKAVEIMASAQMYNTRKISPEEQTQLTQKVLEMQIFSETRKNLIKDLEAIEPEAVKGNKQDLSLIH